MLFVFIVKLKLKKRVFLPTDSSLEIPFEIEVSGPVTKDSNMILECQRLKELSIECAGVVALAGYDEIETLNKLWNRLQQELPQELTLESISIERNRNLSFELCRD